MNPLSFALALGLVLVPPSSASAQGGAVAPPEVKKSALEAVKALGDQVVKGEHSAALERMYPRWKERMAKRKGGIEKLEEELRGIGAVMARNGVSLIGFKTDGEPTVYEVDPKGEGEGVVFDKWLVILPTVTTFRIMDRDSLKQYTIDSHGFQVAIAGKETLDWTFINGSDVTVNELRSMFVTLPANMALPEVKREATE